MRKNFFIAAGIAYVLWSLIATGLLFKWVPLPVPDYGHRCFAVPHGHAAQVIVSILKRHGLSELFTFDTGSTNQVLLSDNTTVLIYFDDPSEVPHGTLSIVTSNPVEAAESALEILKYNGFKAEIKRNVAPELGDKLVLLTSDAFSGWVMVFRRHALAMGEPPNKRMISKP